MPSCCRVSLRSIFCSTLNLNKSEQSGQRDPETTSIQVLHESNLKAKVLRNEMKTLCVWPGQVDLHLLPLDVVGPLLQQLSFDDGLQGGQRNLLTGQNHHHAHVFTFIEHLQHLVHSTRLCGAIAELSWGWRLEIALCCVFQRMERTSVRWRWVSVILVSLMYSLSFVNILN